MSDTGNLLWDPLSASRRRATGSVIDTHLREIREFHENADRSHFLNGLESLADRLWPVYLDALKLECGEESLRSVLCGMDEYVRQGPAEFMDREDYPELLRKLEVFQLHCFNLVTGAYQAAADVLGSIVQSSPGSWKRAGILDLASGYGGFPAFLARRYPDLPVTGSDIQPSYVEDANRREPDRENLHYEVINALDMGSQPGGSRLAVTILQAVHHFRPGQLARLIHEGVRVGRRGIVVADAVRSPLLPPALAAGTSLFTWNPFFVMDAVWSGLRMYHAAELALIAKIAVPGAHVTTHLAAPAFNIVHIEGV